MLVLFETPAGYALFKVLDKTKLAKAEDVYKHFGSSEAAQSVVKLKAFSKFEDTTSALAAATSICDGKLDKGLKSFLKEAILKGKEDADKVRKTNRTLPHRTATRTDTNTQHTRQHIPFGRSRRTTQTSYDVAICTTVDPAMASSGSIRSAALRTLKLTVLHIPSPLSLSCC